MFTLVRANRHDEINAHEDHVVLADGSVMTVPRANLAAAKALLAAEHAAQRRMMERRQDPRRSFSPAAAS